MFIHIEINKMLRMNNHCHFKVDIITRTRKNIHHLISRDIKTLTMSIQVL